MGRLGRLGLGLKVFCSENCQLENLAFTTGQRADLIVSEQPESGSLIMLVVGDQAIVCPNLK